MRIRKRKNGNCDFGVFSFYVYRFFSERRNAMRKINVMLMFSVIVGVSYVAGATPVVEINGLNGAEHWVWVEAETGTGTGTGGWKDSRGISGWTGNPDTYSQSYKSNGWVQWDFHAPANMGAGTKLYLRMAANSVKTNVIKIDGVDAGFIDDVQTSSWTYPNAMTEANLSVANITQGNHTLKIEHPNSYCDRSFDGFFIYDGQIDTSASDWNSVLSEGGDWSWHLIAPPHSSDSPEITSTSATITGIGLESGMYLQITLDGATYNSGDPIAPGQHELVVKIKKSGTTQVYGFAGANFTVVPEPATIGLFAIGIAGLLRKH